MVDKNKIKVGDLHLCSNHLNVRKITEITELGTVATEYWWDGYVKENDFLGYQNEYGYDDRYTQVSLEEFEKFISNKKDNAYKKYTEIIKYADLWLSKVNNMENNIFEGAKFGDKFLTRDGRVAIFDKFTIRNNSYTIICYHEDLGVTEYQEDGKCIEFNSGDVDIISRYQEQIDEDKLDELAKKESNQAYISYEIKSGIEYGFKAGYRKAKEE